MTKVTLIAAVGKNGELGLKGELPWGLAFPEDRREFRIKTRDSIIIVGHRTFEKVCHLQNTYGRYFIKDTTVNFADRKYYLENLFKDFPNCSIFIAGGAKTYQKWLPFVTNIDITVLPWSGPADCYMPPLFGATK